MTAAALVADLRKRGVALAVVGDRLRWRAPKGVMTEAMVKALRCHKADVLAALNARKAQRWGDAAEAVAWFLATEPPSEPFVLVWSDRGQRPAVKITDPEAYWNHLARDVGRGAAGHRAKFGGLQHDLSQLSRLFGGGCLDALIAGDR